MKDEWGCLYLTLDKTGKTIRLQAGSQHVKAKRLGLNADGSLLAGARLRSKQVRG